MSHLCNLIFLVVTGKIIYLLFSPTKALKSGVNTDSTSPAQTTHISCVPRPLRLVATALDGGALLHLQLL